MTGNPNPGNFANRPREEIQDIASKGGKTGTENAGFASMPKDKVVSFMNHHPCTSLRVQTTSC